MDEDAEEMIITLTITTIIFLLLGVILMVVS